jgi:hypothetical protein
MGKVKGKRWEERWGRRQREEKRKRREEEGGKREMKAET